MKPLFCFTAFCCMLCFPGTTPAQPKTQSRVFFPPPAPVYGAPLGTSPRRNSTDPESEPPDRLGDFVGEFFYPPLSTRLAANDLSKTIAQQLAAYMANRASLLNELQNELVAVQNADPATRENELRAFASAQNPRVLALEAEADSLREKLIDPGLLRPSVDWSKDRNWRVTPTGFTSRTSEAQVLRAAAYYQKGLTAEQRGMLCELAVASPSYGDDEADFFSPEMSRLELPELRPELEAKLERYLNAKGILKDELRDAVVAHDRSSRSERDAAFAQLAESQWPRLSELAQLADIIRRELVALPAPPPPPLPPQLPQPLLARIEVYNNAKRALDAERARRSRPTLDLTLLGSTRNARVVPGGYVHDSVVEYRRQIRQDQTEFLQENSERILQLDREQRSIYTEMVRFAAAHTDPSTGLAMDLRAFLRLLHASENYFDRIAREEVLYKNYRTAMLEPGLSPAQRRLLFSAARVALSQALPNGETFPRGR